MAPKNTEVTGVVEAEAEESVDTVIPDAAEGVSKTETPVIVQEPLTTYFLVPPPLWVGVVKD